MFSKLVLLILYVHTVYAFYDEFSELMHGRKHAELGIVQGPMFGKERKLPHDSFYDPPPGVSFSGVFGNGTVLQRAPNLASVYGFSPLGSVVTVLITNATGYQETKSVAAMSDGTWKYTLSKPMMTGGNYTVTVSCNTCNNKMSLYNITFGDVWYCSGQSNMELSLIYSVQRNVTWDLMTQGRYSNIRFYTIGHMAFEDSAPAYVVPQASPGSGRWTMNPTRDEFHAFSAVCWYYAQELTEMLGDEAPPIGLINTAVGGTQVEQWTRNNTLTSCKGPKRCDADAGQCGILYNSMVKPYLNMTIKGVVWYQGENNMHEDKGNWRNNTGYACMFKTMLEQWRHDWSVTPGTTDPQFGFGIVTLAAGTSEGGPDMGNMRWAQTLNYGTLPNPACPKCFMAQAYDLGDPWNGGGCWARGNNKCTGWGMTVPYSSTRTPYFMGSIHPRVKYEVGRRLATSAMSVVYGRKQAWTGPTIKSCSYKRGSKNGWEFTIQFDTDMMNPQGIQNASQNKIFVYDPPYPTQTDGPMRLLFNDTWTGIQLNQRSYGNGLDGKLYFKYYPVDNTPPTGLRYMWDASCCPNQNTAIMPCVPRSCPVMMRYNISYTDVNLQVGLETGLPPNPFWAKLVADSPTSGHCECFDPQVCS